jgi:hypothetical protein
MFYLRALRVLRGEIAVCLKRKTYREEHEGHEENTYISCSFGFLR